MWLCDKYVTLMHFIMILIIASAIEAVTNSTEKLQIIVPQTSAGSKLIEIQNKSIDRIVQEQTDLIKKIVSSHKLTDYPVVTRKDADIKEDLKLKAEKEKLSIQELRHKCQEIFLAASHTIESEKEEMRKHNQHKESHRDTVGHHSTQHAATVEGFDFQQKPLFLQKPKLPPSFPHPHLTTKKPTSYHYVTTSHPLINTTPIPVKPNNVQPHFDSTQTDNLQVLPHTHTYYQNNIKYIKLEPVILQKTILSDGKMLYYWYKNLPPFSPYMPTPKGQFYSSVQSEKDTSFSQESLLNRNTHTSLHNIQQQQKQPIVQASQHTHSQVVPHFQSTTNYPTTSTTTEIVPQYEINYNTKTNHEEQMYKQQLKFVVPLPYPQTEPSAQFPRGFDAYAYYPRELQPSTVNIPVPYVPTFHMIRTLAMPRENVPHFTQNFENKQ